MIVFMFLSAVVPRGFPLIVVLLCVHVVLFGVLAYSFPEKYILPAWILNLILLFLGVMQIATSLIEPHDPNSFPYVESGSVRYHTFSLNKVFLAVLGLFFLIILFRPALFHAKILWKKLR